MNCLHLNSEQDTWRESCVFIPKYSWTPLIRTQLFQILCYFKFKTISLGFALQSSTIDYFKLLLFRTFFFCFPQEFAIAGFNCIYSSQDDIADECLEFKLIWLQSLPWLDNI